MKSIRLLQMSIVSWAFLKVGSEESTCKQATVYQPGRKQWEVEVTCTNTTESQPSQMCSPCDCVRHLSCPKNQSQRAEITTENDAIRWPSDVLLFSPTEPTLSSSLSPLTRNSQIKVYANGLGSQMEPRK